MMTRNKQLLARWSGKLPSYNCCSPLQLYEWIESLILEKGLSGISFSYVTRREGGWFSARRIYLRIRYKQFFFDVCAFIAGNSLVISYWLHIDSSGVLDLFAEIPVISLFIERIFKAQTYYSIDYVEHFQQTVHQALLQVIDELSENSGQTIILHEGRQPVWEEIW